MAVRYRVPLPGLFYYSGRVGPRRWLPRGSHTGSGPRGCDHMRPITHPPFVVFGVMGRRRRGPITLECGGRLTPVGWTGERRGP